MSNKYLWLLPLLAVLSCMGCSKVQKNVKDYYPQVETISATVQADGSVLVKGRMISEGADPVQFLGFCMDTLTLPDMLSGQQLTDTLRDGVFQTVYRDLKPFTRYYFRAFTANANGYTIGDPVSIDSAVIDPSAIPCNTPADSVIVLRGSSTRNTYPFSYAEARNPRTIDLYAYDCAFYMEFGTAPAQGEFTITDAGSFDGRYVRILVSMPGVSGVYLDEGKVYLKAIDPDHFEIRFCEALLTYGPGYKVSARFTSPKYK